MRAQIDERGIGEREKERKGYMQLSLIGIGFEASFAAINNLGTPLFSKIKGRTEKDLLTLPSTNTSYSSLRIYNVRPGYVDPSASAIPLDRPRTLTEKVGKRVLAPLFWMMPSLKVPADKLGEYLVRLALGDGEPVKNGQGIEAGGRTVRNTAIRDAMDL